MMDRRDFLKFCGRVGGGIITPLWGLSSVDTPTNNFETIESLLLNDMRNIGFLALDIERAAGIDVDVYSYHLLDEILSTSERKIILPRNNISRLSPSQAISFLSSIKYLLHNDFGYTLKVTTRLSEALVKKDEGGQRPADCDLLSLLYLAIAERNKINLASVVAPGHMFIRFHFNPRIYLDYETTSGSVTNDQHYYHYNDTWPIHQTSVEKGVYLRSLSKPETLAFVVHYLAEGYYHKAISKEGKYSDFRSMLKLTLLSLKANPLNPFAWARLAKSATFLRDYNQALEYCDKAIYLDPNYAEAYYLKGRVLLIGMKNEKESRKYLDRAHALNPIFKK